MDGRVFTVGHSTHSLTDFIALLKMHGIEALADVRSSPYSRFTPHFNRESLRSALKGANIAYVFLGDELGARPKDPTVYRGGRAEYELIANTELFKSGLRRVQAGVRGHRVALMCAEKDPLECHRTLLVGDALERAGLRLTHIHSDGSLEENQPAMKRLARKLALPVDDLFEDEARVIEHAKRLQADRIAYSEKVDEE